MHSSSFLILTSFCVLMVGAEGYCRTGLHTFDTYTLSRSPLDAGSARRRVLYLTTHDTHNRHLRYIRYSKPRSERVFDDTSLRPHGHLDRRYVHTTTHNFIYDSSA